MMTRVHIFLIGTGVFAIIMTVAVLSFNAVALDTQPAAKTRYLSIPACAFQPVVVNSDYEVHTEGNTLWWFAMQSGKDYGYFNAPVFLPDGAKIKQIKLICMNNDTPDISISLMESTIVNGAINETKLASVASTGMEHKWKTFSAGVPGSPKVNNSGACYYVELYMGEVEAMDVMVHHVEIVYKSR